MVFPSPLALLASGLVLAACGGSTDVADSGRDQPGSPSLLIGTWTSTDDPDAVVEFTADMYTDIYAGERLDSASYTVSDGCDGAEADLFAFTVEVDDDPLCYSVSELTDTRLEYTMAGGRGNTLSYTRAATAR